MRWKIWFEAARPRTLPAAIAPVLVGSAIAWRDGSFDALAATLCLGFALLIQIGTNFANDYYDYVNGADTAARVGPRRAVAAGLVSGSTMRSAMGATFAAAFCCGLGLLAWGGPWLLVIGIASIACGVAYTGGPWPLGYHGLGDLFVFVFFGCVAVGATYFVQAGHLGTDAVIASVPIGLLAANILAVNNYRDVETDRIAGKRTLVVRFGRRFARTQHALSLAVAIVTPIYFGLRDRRAAVLLPVLIAPLAWGHVQRLRQASTPGELIALLGDSGKLLAIYALLFSAGFVLERI
jgi:1,4-dihydroxy-2-naphthoate octaprenyltransferase